MLSYPPPGHGSQLICNFCKGTDDDCVHEILILIMITMYIQINVSESRSRIHPACASAPLGRVSCQPENRSVDRAPASVKNAHNATTYTKPKARGKLVWAACLPSSETSRR